MLTSSDRRLSCSMNGTILRDLKVNRHLQPVDSCFHDFLHLKQRCNRKRKCQDSIYKRLRIRIPQIPNQIFGDALFCFGVLFLLFFLFEEHFKVHLQRSVIGYTTLPSLALNGGRPLLQCPPQTSVSYPYLLQILVFMHIIFAHFFYLFFLVNFQMM